MQKSIELTGGMPMTIAGLGYLYACTGERDKAEKVLHELKAILHDRHVTSSVLSFIYAGLKDREKFFECMNQGDDGHSPLLAFLKALPEYDGMRSDPRFQELLRHLGFAP